MEDSLYDVESMRRFAGVDISGVPDEATICKFRHFLEAYGLTVGAVRAGQALSVRAGPSGARRLYRGRHDYSCAVVYEEPGRQAGPRDGQHEEGQYVALRHEGRRGHSVVTTSASVHDW